MIGAALAGFGDISGQETSSDLLSSGITEGTKIGDIRINLGETLKYANQGPIQQGGQPVDINRYVVDYQNSSLKAMTDIVKPENTSSNMLILGGLILAGVLMYGLIKYH